MTARWLVWAWGALIALSLASTVLALWPDLTGLGAMLLVLAWLKARVILLRYLGLVQAPFWARGFGIALALFALLLLGLYLLPLIL